MTELQRSSHQHGTPARDSVHHEPDPHTIYVMSNDLSFFARGHRQHAPSGAAGKWQTP
jgi:hypothetical protein